jgi:hypothetical protein
MKSSGKQTTRSLGSLWTLGDMENVGPDGQPTRFVITLGFDPVKQRFVGTFVASCMNHLWPYDGQLNAARKVLTLDSKGPSFAVDGTMAKYQDIDEIMDKDQYLLSSRFKGRRINSCRNHRPDFLAHLGTFFGGLIDLQLMALLGNSGSVDHEL